MRGFTLVQLLVAMAVLGLVATLVILGQGGAQAQSRDIHRIATINQAAAAITQYHEEKHAYPVAKNWSALCEMLKDRLTSCPQDVGAHGYHYAYGPRQFQVWVELERPATALRGAKNINTQGWNGEGVDASSLQDRIYDQGVR